MTAPESEMTAEEEKIAFDAWGTGNRPYPSVEQAIVRAVRAAHAAGMEEAAKIVEGEWQPESNINSPEYILRHRIAAAIRTRIKDQGK